MKQDPTVEGRWWFRQVDYILSDEVDSHAALKMVVAVQIPKDCENAQTVLSQLDHR